MSVPMGTAVVVVLFASNESLFALVKGGTLPLLLRCVTPLVADEEVADSMATDGDCDAAALLLAESLLAV